MKLCFLDSLLPLLLRGHSGQGWPSGLLQPTKLPADVDLILFHDSVCRQLTVPWANTEVKGLVSS